MPTDLEIISQFVRNKDPQLLELLSEESQLIFLERSRRCLRRRVGNNQVAALVVTTLDNRYATALSRVRLVSWNVASLRARIVDNLTASEAEKKLSRSDPQRPILEGSPLDQLIKTGPDLICLQETKIGKKGTEELFTQSAYERGYKTYWSTGKKPGYSGVTTWVSKDLDVEKSRKGFPKWVLDSLPQSSRDRLDKYNSGEVENPSTHPLVNEGRIVAVSLPGLQLIVVNTYVPNTQRAGNKTDSLVQKYEEEKKNGTDPPHSVKFNPGSGKAGLEIVMDYRCDWDLAMKLYLTALQEHGDNAMDDSLSCAGKSTEVVWCGDMNVAKDLNDLYHGIHSVDRLWRETSSLNTTEAKEKGRSISKTIGNGIKMNTKGGFSGFRLEERTGIENILRESGLVDAYRVRHPHNICDLRLQELFEMEDEALYQGLSKTELLQIKKRSSSRGFTYWDQTPGKEWRTQLNNGMRIDYFFVSKTLRCSIENVRVLEDLGLTEDCHPSDHAPIVLDINSI